MEEIAVVLATRFGDEQSTLLDQFERLSFEIQLNQAILGRSLSEPCRVRSHFQPPPPPPPPPALVTHVQQGRRPRSGLGFYKVLKKLLKPILGRKGTGREVPDPMDSQSWKKFAVDLFGTDEF